MHMYVTNFYLVLVNYSVGSLVCNLNTVIRQHVFNGYKFPYKAILILINSNNFPFCGLASNLCVCVGGVKDQRECGKKCEKRKS